MKKQAYKHIPKDYSSLNEKEMLEELERLECKNVYLKKVRCLITGKRKITKKDKVGIILGLRQKHKIKVLLTIANIPKSSYYYMVNSFSETDKHSTQKALIQGIFETNLGLYGYRRVTLELWNQGIKINHKTVLKLMKELGLKGKVRSRQYQSSVLENT